MKVAKKRPTTWLKYLALAIFIVLPFLGFYLGYQYQNPSEIRKQLPPVPSELPSAGTITIDGELVCLPHKNTNDPQTMECAFGLKDDLGKYYALHDLDPTYKNLSYPTGKRYEVTGEFTPQTDAQYPTIGTIKILSLTPL